ncbi:MAG: DUF1294 domain-containing protein [Intestinibacillus sp.]
MEILLYYLLAVNVIGALVVALDKWKARRGKWRVPERTLFAFCVLGGCPGVYLSMRSVRHKTLHRRFMWGIPAIFILQIAIISAIYYFLLRGGHTL